MKELSTVICAQAKTGSTLLYYTLKNITYFDHHSFEPKKKLPDPDKGNVLCKVVSYDFRNNFEPLHKGLRNYQNGIILTRDPRDTLVSNLCYRGITIQNHAKKARYYDHLEQKSKDPASVTLCDLYTELQNVSGFDLLAEMNTGCNFIRECRTKYPRFLPLSYENLIEGNTNALAEYLLVDTFSPAVIDDVLSRKRVYREGAADSWRNWFTPTDVEFFSNCSFFLDYMKFFFYNHKDWDLNDTQIILPEHSYKYYKGLVGL